MKKKNVLASVLLAGALFLSACGGSASTSTSASGVSGRALPALPRAWVTCPLP